MASYDNGAYIKVVVDGKKEDGTEIHTVNRKALGIDSRDDAKTWFLNVGNPSRRLLVKNYVNSVDTQTGQY
jgi:hypothetical protein